MAKLFELLNSYHLLQGGMDALASAFAGAGLYMLLESDKSIEGIVLCALAVILTVTRQVLKQLSSCKTR